MVFGVVCTTMAVAASYMGGIVQVCSSSGWDYHIFHVFLWMSVLLFSVPQVALSIHGICGGPMLGLFSLGILFPVTNLKVHLYFLNTTVQSQILILVGIEQRLHSAVPCMHQTLENIYCTKHKTYNTNIISW